MSFVFNFIVKSITAKKKHLKQNKIKIIHSILFMHCLGLLEVTFVRVRGKNGAVINNNLHSQLLDYIIKLWVLIYDFPKLQINIKQNEPDQPDVRRTFVS